MGLDFQSEAAQNSSSNASNNNNAGEHQRSSSAKSRDEPTENGTDQDPSMFVRIKGEPEPTPSTSAQGEFVVGRDATDFFFIFFIYLFFF